MNEIRNGPFGFPMGQYDPSLYPEYSYTGWAGKMPLGAHNTTLGSMGKTPLSFPWSMTSPTSSTMPANSFSTQTGLPFNSMAALNSSLAGVQTSTAAQTSWDKLSQSHIGLPTQSSSPYSTQTSPYTAAAMYRFVFFIYFYWFFGFDSLRVRLTRVTVHVQVRRILDELKSELKCDLPC